MKCPICKTENGITFYQGKTCYNCGNDLIAKNIENFSRRYIMEKIKDYCEEQLKKEKEK